MKYLQAAVRPSSSTDQAGPPRSGSTRSCPRWVGTWTRVVSADGDINLQETKRVVDVEGLSALFRSILTLDREGSSLEPDRKKLRLRADDSDRPVLCISPPPGGVKGRCALASDLVATGTLSDRREDIPSSDRERAGVMRPPERFRITVLDPGYDAPSIWTKDGGIVVNQTPKHVGVITALYDSLLSGNTGALDAGNPVYRLFRGFDFYLRGVREYEYPGISRQEPRDQIERINSGAVEVESRSIDEKTKDQLEKLGYRWEIVICLPGRKLTRAIWWGRYLHSARNAGQYLLK